MHVKPRLACVLGGILALACSSQFARTESAQSRSPRVLVTKNIEEAKLVTLRGNVRPEVNTVNDRGAVSENFAMEHMLLQLQRPPELEKELQQFIEDLYDPKSPNFHKWITAQQFGQRFGVAQQDIDALTRWLGSYGFNINAIYPSNMLIDFSGTASQVRAAFHTEIHNLEVKGTRHVANMSEPQIPAALAPVVLGIVSLHNFRPHGAHKMRMPSASYTFAGSSGGTEYGMVPGDLATIYNLNPLFTSGVTGKGQTIALIEDTDLYTTSDWKTFRSTFGLSSFSSGSLTTVHPGSNCLAPGLVGSNEAEAILDAEWATAAAPNAAIEMATCADTATTFGGLIAIENLINASSQPPAIMSVSYSACEAEDGSSSNAAFNSAYQQAASEGVSVFVAAGDSGASSCDNGASAATHGIGANALASSPYDVAVGGTDFGDTYSHTNSTYWSSTNSSTSSSARSYVPEIPWDNSCASSLISSFEGYSTTYGSGGFCNSPLGQQHFETTVAGGGGPSGCASGSPSISGVVSGSCQGWAKPSWQSVLGNPSDGVRDLPDVSLFAANGVWSHYYVICFSDLANGGALCSGSPSGWSGAGGTSFAAPILAGIQALVNQSTGARQGNPNSVYYQLAAGEYGSSGSSSCNSSNGNSVGSSCIFYDVTQGDMDVNCTGSSNCYLPSGFEGVLSTSNSSSKPAFGTKVGWDFATGIGTVNAANLVKNWPGSSAPPPSQPDFSLSASPSSLTITQGSSGSSKITVNALNGFNSSVSLAASGQPTGVTASFSSNPATGSSTLTLSASGTATLGTTTVTVTGTSGSLTHTTTISLTVSSTAPAPSQPDFSLSASPGSVTITQGGSSSSSTITINPINSFSGSVNLTASGPSGISASFSPNPATGSSTLTLSASSTATLGTGNITITGTSGSLSHTTTISLTVNAPAPPPSQPDFLLSASPSSLTVGQGSITATTITITPQGGFNSPVFLFVLNPPPGVFAGFSANPANRQSILTFSTFSITPQGTYSVTLLGFGGNTIHEINVTLRVAP
ncbi:MAG: hypothetical protein DMG40_15005 [Acidobacteria bacterium]|nr:MAG: hypothetical protein DMG40_15005 [Acidobacteriota bacterium]